MLCTGHHVCGCIADNLLGEMHAQVAVWRTDSKKYSSLAKDTHIAFAAELQESIDLSLGSI